MSRRKPEIDVLRGIVMVLMALDHARDYFGMAMTDPSDLSWTTPALFFTRWVTHFCAPVFVFLAGTGAYLYGQRLEGSRRRLSMFLISRGIWLVVLELTVIMYCWWFTFDNGVFPGSAPTVFFLQVIWAIGISMIGLALLVHLPMWVITAFGLLMVCLHNLLDGMTVAASTPLPGILWSLLHVKAYIPLGDRFAIFVIYPIIPWVGVMALGYAFGQIVSRPPDVYRRTCTRMGVLMILLFLLLRLTNLYGDPSTFHWQVQGETRAFSEGSIIYPLLSMLNCEKYPPSLNYLLMTLGPAILVLPRLGFQNGGRVSGWVRDFFLAYGRVPLFYYILHLVLLNLGAGLYFGLAWGVDRWSAGMFKPLPPGFEPTLPLVYLAWGVAVLLLFLPCLWYGRYKARSHSRWLSYL